MRLLDCRHRAKTSGKVGKAFLIGGFCKSCVHLVPFVMIAVRRRAEISRATADAAELAKPKLCMLFFVVGGLEKYCRDLLIALSPRDRRKIGIPTI